MPKKILAKEKWVPAEKLNLPKFIRDKDGQRELVIGMLIVRRKEYLVTERRFRVKRRKSLISTESHEIYVLNDVFPDNKRVRDLQKEKSEAVLRGWKIDDELREEQDKLVKKINKERVRIAGDYHFPEEEGEY